MKHILSVLTALLLLQTAVLADDAEFRLVVSRNDVSAGGEFHADLEIRISSGGSPKTLSSMTADIYYTSALTQWGSDPSTNWAFDWMDGYTIDVQRLSGYYRILVTGGNVNAANAGSPPGTPPGWDVTGSWQTIATLRWTINTATSVNITIDDGTDAAAYFNNYTNAPKGDATDWVMSNTDLGDVSLPVQMAGIEAMASPSRGVVLNWATESEVETAGFHVWRSEIEAGPYARVSNALIPGQGGSSRTEYSFTDREVKARTYWYKIEEVSFGGAREFHGPISVLGVSLVPDEYALSRNYPNPFNPSTSFDYDLPRPGRVAVKVFTLLGREVKTLLDGHSEAGRFTAVWDATDAAGRAMPSGIYLLRVESGTFSAVRKMTLMR